MFSIFLTGVTSAAVPVTKHSEAFLISFFNICFSTTFIFSFVHNLITVFLVTPFRKQSAFGVINLLLIKKNIFLHCVLLGAFEYENNAFERLKIRNKKVYNKFIKHV